MLMVFTSSEGTSMIDKIAGRWAVVTGASSGLGAVFAEQLAQRGMSLLLAGRDERRLAQVRERIHRESPDVAIDLVVGELGTHDGVERLVAALADREIDVLVNNAGFGTYGAEADIDAGREDELVGVNVAAMVHLTHAVLPGMLDR